MSDTATSPVILLAYANKQGDYLPFLKNERDRLDAALQGLQDRDAIQVKPLWETSLDGLFTALAHYGDRVAIIHYAGHADSGALHLESATGTEMVHAEGFARRFAQLPALKLVFLNGCATQGHVTALLDAGVKAVIATRVAIDDALASQFAAHFYTALASPAGTASIADAFETARAFIAGMARSRPVIVDRGGFNAARPVNTVDTALTWGLYCRDDADVALGWRLPSAAPIDLKGLQERLLRGSIDASDPDLAMFFDLYKLKLGVGASPVPGGAFENFTSTVTALATADDPTGRRAAASVVRGDVAEAFDQLFAAAEAGAQTAATQSASAAARFRQAGALATPTSVTRAITAYMRAAELESGDCWTWIELARLHRRRGEIASGRADADRARKAATNDRDKAAAVNELGDLARATGELAEAQRCFMRGLELAEQVVAAGPVEAEWLRNLSISHNKVGEIAVLLKDFDRARHHFARGLALREQLAAHDPSSIDWQRDLSISHNKLGEVAIALGDRAEAQARFTASLAIREHLVGLDPANTEWQRDLSVSHNKLGDLAKSAGDLAEAERRFTAGFNLRASLAAQDPANTDWQRDLAVSHGRLGGVAAARGDFPVAKRHYIASLAIRQRLAAADPANAEWQRDLSAGHEKLGDLAASAGDSAAARRHFADSLPIARALAARLPDHRPYQHDLAYTRRRLAELGGDAGAP